VEAVPHWPHSAAVVRLALSAAAAVVVLLDLVTGHTQKILILLERSAIEPAALHLRDVRLLQRNRVIRATNGTVPKSEKVRETPRVVLGPSVRKYSAA
jgi:hypothetical protein